MAKQNNQKTFKIERTNYRNGTTSIQEGTLEELLNAYRYTLECGQSYEHEKGNKKINMNPKSAKALVTQLNNAVNNSAANGCAMCGYSLIEEQIFTN